MTTLERFQKGDISSLSRIITHVENRRPGYRQLLAKLYRFERKAVRIGLTGPPGAGKSTLVDCVSRALIKQGESVGVIAVDPSSPSTGGALLGDRVRYHDQTDMGKHFFRSMATRGSQGGLSGATDNVALVMDAFGFDYVLIETVGVGQVELDIVDNCDLVVVILVPESGDAVQTLKAGLTEIADIFVVNKSDRPGAERVVADLTSMLDIRQKQGATEHHIPILATSAFKNEGIDKLVEVMQATLAEKLSSERFTKERKRQMRGKLKRILQQRFINDTREKIGDEKIDKAVQRILDG
ncbi:MAG: methylmalonyl Co-A mutase-associated GTPase MeaB, partial [Candidatus Zixiibacteriota bacterium]